HEEGRIVGIKTRDGMSKAYVWDALRQYPIAEVVNANPHEVAFTSFETGGNEGRWTFSSASSSGDARTGTKYHNLTMAGISIDNLDPTKTYLVAYWLKDGDISLEVESGGQVISQYVSAASEGWS